MASKTTRSRTRRWARRGAKARAGGFARNRRGARKAGRRVEGSSREDEVGNAHLVPSGEAERGAIAGADSHDVIRVHGARENNLKDVSIEIPKRRLTVFTGVSGSGKSSLVFGTIAAESQRLINETYSAFVQGFMPTLARPGRRRARRADDGDHRRPAADGRRPRSTVGTATDANAMLRILFSRLGRPQIGSPNAFAFNVPSVRAQRRDHGRARRRQDRASRRSPGAAGCAPLRGPWVGRRTSTSPSSSTTPGR